MGGHANHSGTGRGFYEFGFQRIGLQVQSGGANPMSEIGRRCLPGTINLGALGCVALAAEKRRDECGRPHRKLYAHSDKLRNVN